MKGKIKIRTMKDDLANANDDDKNEELPKAKQDQSKTDIDTAEISGFSAMSGAMPGKLKDEEIGELKNLIERISKDDDKKNPEERPVEAEKKDVVTNIADEKITSKEQADSKSDEKEDLKNLINKISETIDEKDDKPIQRENTDNELSKEKESETEKTEKNKQSFWNDISEKLKDDESAKFQKASDIKEKNLPATKIVKDIESIDGKNREEEHNNSGILAKKSSFETEEDLEEKKETRKKIYDNDNYQLPENRLIFGKQKRYSSVSKRIKLKEKKDEIEDLKNTDEIKEKQKIISEKEKYEKLKSRLIRKYNIRLFSLPWKKIIPMSITLIVLSGAIYYILIKELVITPPNPPIAIIGTEIEKFAEIENAVEFTKDNIVKMGFKENAINKKFQLNNGVEELRIIIKDNDNIVSLKEALKGMGIETGDFPSSFWETTTENYNIFAIKTKENAFRFAIAIESNAISSLLETMENWEREDVDKRKMFNIFEPFFMDSRIEENFGQRFESANYKYIYIRYINLPNQNISFDYFASDNILIMATSKENTNRIIDILDNDYNYYNGYEN